MTKHNATGDQKSLDDKREAMLSAKADPDMRRQQAEVDAPTLTALGQQLAELRHAFTVVAQTAARLVVDQSSLGHNLSPHVRSIELPITNTETVLKALLVDAQAALAPEA